MKILGVFEVLLKLNTFRIIKNVVKSTKPNQFDCGTEFGNFSQVHYSEPLLCYREWFRWQMVELYKKEGRFKLLLKSEGSVRIHTNKLGLISAKLSKA